MKWFVTAGVIVFSMVIAMLIFMPSFLSYQKTVDSDNIIIESWISAREIEQAITGNLVKNDSHFYLTGFDYPDKIPLSESEMGRNHNVRRYDRGIALWTNGSLEIKIPESVNLNLTDSMQLDLKFSGTEVDGFGPHFNVIVNGECLGGGFAGDQPKSYHFLFIAKNQNVKSIFIRYNNDFWTKRGDRNLFVSAISINGNEIELKSDIVRKCIDLSLETTGFHSQAEEMADYIHQLGVPKNRTTIVAFEPVEHNQTLASAKSFRDHVNVNDLHSVNIITSGLHSRRTWFTYQKILPSNVEVGVHFFPNDARDKDNLSAKINRFFYLISESFSYLANWIILHLQPINK
ncbi:MAG: YdcF family protein [Bacteroidales bacterium]|nr:YdcF family protein [Bacteroidales bacterium]